MTKSQTSPVRTRAGGGSNSSTSGFRPGVIVTTYDLIKNNNNEPLNDDDLKTDGIKVRYMETLGAAPESPIDIGLLPRFINKGVFLCDVAKMKTSLPGYSFFEATYLTPETAAKKLHEEAGDKHLLFCVHGDSTEASEWMGEVAKARDSGFYKRNYPVPVTWPLFSFSLFAYFGNRNNNAKQAGQGLKNFVEIVDNELFPRKSLMMHSMGNHVVFNFACKDGTPNVTFDNIFMVAADIPFDVFHQYPKDSYWFPQQQNTIGNKTQKAKNLKGMLTTYPDTNTPKGKIVVTYTMNDRALQMSATVNRADANRLGRTSAGGYYSRRGWPWQWEWKRDDSKIHDNFKDSIESVHVIDFSGKYELAHTYHLGKEMAERVYDPYVLQD